MNLGNPFLQQISQGQAPQQPSYMQTPIPNYTGSQLIQNVNSAYKPNQTPAPQQQVNTGGGGGGGLSTRQQMERGLIPWDDNLLNQTGGGTNYEDQVRGEIEGGYGNYFGQLDQIMNSLPGQRTNQEQIVQNQYGASSGDLDTQLAQGQRDLGTTRTRAEGQQNKTLKDIASDIANQMIAGNVFLGAKGAGDSSAANMYSYALTKMGNKQRGDVQGQYANIYNDIGDREFKLQSTVDQEKRKLTSDRDNKVLQIAQWFEDAQNQIRQMRGSGELSKGQDLASLSQQLLNNALSQLNQAQANWQNRQSMLEQWAMQTSGNTSQLRNNLSQVSSFNPSMPNAQPIAGQPQMTPGGGFNVAAGYGNTTDEEQNPFGF